MQNTVTRIFLNSDLRCQHDGLKRIARSSRVNLDKLKQNEHVLFINTKKTMVKMYSSNGVLSFLKTKKGQPLDLDVIAEIPKAFGVISEMQYKKRLEEKLIKKLNIKLKENKNVHNSHDVNINMCKPRSTKEQLFKDV